MADNEQDEHAIASCIQGYHGYHKFWTLTIREILSCQRQPSSISDRYAVSVDKGSCEVVGHPPQRISRIFHCSFVMVGWLPVK